MLVGRLSSRLLLITFLTLTITYNYVNIHEAVFLYVIGKHHFTIGLLHRNDCVLLVNIYRTHIPFDI